MILHRQNISMLLRLYYRYLSFKAQIRLGRASKIFLSLPQRRKVAHVDVGSIQDGFK